MTSDDPWADLAPPSSVDAVSARRVDSDLPWGFFWGVSPDNHCLLLLRHSPDNPPLSRLPRLRGVEMYESQGDEHGPRALVLQLEDRAQREIFQRLCVDIVTSAGRAPTEREAVEAFLARTWRWHHLLRGGSDSRLSLEEQEGLIGELIVLSRIVLKLPALSAPISAWHGPTGAPKDFEIGRVCIEVKAHRGGATPFVEIHSEHQLDRAGVGALFLYVVNLTQQQAASEGGLTVTDYALSARQAVAVRDAGAVEAFETLLAAAGFRWEDDYSDTRWVEGEHQAFAVDQGFPAIIAASCPAGVSKVRYSLSLTQCAPHRVTTETIVAALTGGASAT